MTSASVQNDRTIGRRMAPRAACSLMVEFKGRSQPWRRAMLADLSTTGFRLTGINAKLEDFGSLWIRPYGMVTFGPRRPLVLRIMRWAASFSIRWTLRPKPRCEGRSRSGPAGDSLAGDGVILSLKRPCAISPPCPAHRGGYRDFSFCCPTIA